MSSKAYFLYILFASVKHVSTLFLTIVWKDVVKFGMFVTVGKLRMCMAYVLKKKSWNLTLAMHRCIRYKY